MASFKAKLNGSLGSAFSGLGSLAGGSGPVAAFCPIDVSRFAAAWGSVQIFATGYSGPVKQIVRASDNATLDLYPGSNGQIPDYAAADSWSGGSVTTIANVYDQTGGGFDLTQPTASLRPTFSALVPRNSIRPIQFTGQLPTSACQRMIVPALPTINRNDFGIYMAIEPHVNYPAQAFMEFGGAGNPKIYLGQIPSMTSGGGTFMQVDATNNKSSRRQSCTPQSFFLRSNGSGRYLTTRGVQYTNAVAASSVLDTAGLMGATQLNTTYSSNYTNFATLIFKTTPTPTELAQLDAWIATLLAIPSAATDKLIVYSGSSLIEGWYTSNNLTVPYLAGFDDTWTVFNMGSGGRSLATEYSGYAGGTGTAALYDGSKIKNILVIDAPSNDVAGFYANQAAAEAAAGTIYNTTTLAYVADALTTGFRVVVPTIIARNGFDTTTNFREYARLEYNRLAVAGAGAHGYTTADRCSDARLGLASSTSNTTYFAADGIHLVTAGSSILAAIDRAAIDAA